MRKDSFMKSGIYRILDYVARLVILNVLVLIISFSLLIVFSDQWWPLIITGLTFFPSIVSMFKVIKDYEDGKNPSIFKPFFVNFGKYYVKSIILTVIILASAFLLVNSLTVFASNYNESVANIIGYYLTISVIIVAVFVLIQLPLVIVNFEGLSIIQYLKLSAVMGFKDIVLSFLTIVIVGAFLITALVYPIVAGVIGISLPVYLITKMTYKRYSLLSDKHALEEE
ncbi:MAG: DUF624 domain-containing protein [Bacilli bacterium]|nr:DUF624 domain-containing protein [Bacilli bacterium]